MCFGRPSSQTVLWSLCVRVTAARLMSSRGPRRDFAALTQTRASQQAWLHIGASRQAGAVVTQRRRERRSGRKRVRFMQLLYLLDSCQ